MLKIRWSHLKHLKSSSNIEFEKFVKILVLEKIKEENLKEFSMWCDDNGIRRQLTHLILLIKMEWLKEGIGQCLTW